MHTYIYIFVATHTHIPYYPAVVSKFRISLNASAIGLPSWETYQPMTNFFLDVISLKKKEKKVIIQLF